MNYGQQTEAEHDDTERLVAHTLRRAGVRNPVPAEFSAAVEREVNRAWRTALHRRSMQHAIRLIAASVAVAAIGLLAWKAPAWIAARSSTAGILVASKGPVEFGSLLSTHRFVGGQAMPSGATIRTGPQGRALLAFGPLTLRLGGSSEARLVNAGTLGLSKGAVYLDSNNSVKPFAILTPFGRIEHLGTQYQVRIGNNGLTVGVRQGLVRVVADGPAHDVSERQALSVTRAGAFKLLSIAPYGEFWNWTEDVRPDFPIEGRTLADLLQWYSEETGHGVQYADGFARSSAETTRLSGSITDLSPSDALQAVLAATRFTRFMQADGSVLISLPADLRDKLLSDGADSVQVPRLDSGAR